MRYTIGKTIKECNGHVWVHFLTLTHMHNSTLWWDSGARNLDLVTPILTPAHVPLTSVNSSHTLVYCIYLKYSHNCDVIPFPSRDIYAMLRWWGYACDVINVLPCRANLFFLVSSFSFGPFPMTSLTPHLGICIHFIVSSSSSPKLQS